MRELEDREEVARELGIPTRFVTSHLLAQIARDPLVLEHVEACRKDEDMLAILVRLNRANISPLEHDQESIWSTIITRRKLFSREDEYSRRLQVCRSCEHAAAIPIVGGHRCRLCGCVVELKAKLQNEVCPDATWGAEGRWS